MADNELEFYGVIRYIQSSKTWSLLSDANHIPKNITHITSNQNNNGFSVGIDNPNTSIWKVGTVNITSDESLIKWGVFCGASFSLTYLSVPIIQVSGFTAHMNGVSEITTGVNIVKPDITTEWDDTAKVLTITHLTVGNSTSNGQGVGDYSFNVIGRSNSNFTRAVSDLSYTPNRAKIKLKFYDHNNNVVKPSGQWYYTRNMPWQPLNKEISAVGSNANFWIYGKLVKVTT